VSGFRWLGVGAVLAACVGYLIYSAGGAAGNYYVTVAELRAHPPAGEVRVAGVVQDDVVRGEGGLLIHFTTAEGGARLPVVYRGPLPDIFQPGQQVVVEGRLDGDGVFQARSLFAKCPSRFTAAAG